MIVRDFRLCIKDFFPSETLLSIFPPQDFMWLVVPENVSASEKAT